MKLGSLDRFLFFFRFHRVPGGYVLYCICAYGKVGNFQHTNKRTTAPFLCSLADIQFSLPVDGI